MQTLEREQSAAIEAAPTTTPRRRAPRSVHVDVVLRWAVAALLLGAAGIHFGMMGEHAGVSWTHGGFFAAVAWLQIAVAAALVFRPGRRVVGAVLALNLGILGVWVLTRTVGIAIGSDGTPDAWGTVDGICAAFEALAILLCLPLLGRMTARRSISAAVGSGGIAFVGIVAAALTTLAFSPAFAGGSGSGASSGGGHVHSRGPAASGAAPAVGHVHAHTGPANADQVAELAPDRPLDVTTRARLADQLVVARQAAMQYPTVADARRAGMILAGGFAPLVGAHYVAIAGAIHPNLPDGSLDVAHPGTYIYDGTSPTSKLVGLMYLSMTAAPPEGFAGPNDHWHRHFNTCIKYGAGAIEVPFPADRDVTKRQCDAVGGQFRKQTLWMAHAWVVPGWESPAGVFSHDNANLHCADNTDRTDKAGFCAGT